MSYLRCLALKIWTSFWRRESSFGMDVWNAPMVQSKQILTYRLMERPGRPKMTWKQLTEWDCSVWKLLAIDPHDRYTWRSVFFFFFFLFGFYGPFNNISLISSNSSSKVGKNRRKNTWPSISRTWLSHMWPELGGNPSGEKTNRLRIISPIHEAVGARWRSGVRSAMYAASQLPGRGTTDVDVAPVPAC